MGSMVPRSSVALATAIPNPFSTVTGHAETEGA